jgi:RNA polymerase sigma-70 factor (ECF subfamily)
VPKDPQAITELYRRLEPALFRKCVSMLHDDELARDATQELFVKLAAAADTLRDEEAELAWALKAAHNHCLNLLRAQKRRSAREGEGGPESQVLSPVTNRQLGRSVLEGLSATSRALVVGHLIDDEDQADLARKHGVSAKTVSRKLKKAVEQARTLIKRKGGGG